MRVTYTPAEIRAQIAKVRALAWQVADARQFSLESGRACGMLEIAAEQIEKLTDENAFLTRALGLNSGDAVALKLAHAKIENLKQSLELTETAYNASLDLQAVLLDRCEKLRARAK
jgi:hypothetical protein